MTLSILCSGELYAHTLTPAECLDCALALKGQQPCGYGYRLLKAMFATQEDRTREIHVTDLTGCLLKSYLDKASPSPRYVHDMLALWIGIAVHNALDISDANVTSEIPVNGMGIVGRVDAAYDDNRIEDAKTKRWIKPSQLHNDQHADQVNIYRALRGNGGDLQIQYIDMSGPSKCRKDQVTMRMINGEVACPKCGYTSKENHLGALLVDIPVREDTEAFARQRVTILADAIDSGIAPEAEPSWLCGYCPHTICVHNKEEA